MPPPPAADFGNILEWGSPDMLAKPLVSALRLHGIDVACDTDKDWAVMYNGVRIAQIEHAGGKYVQCVCYRDGHTNWVEAHFDDKACVWRRGCTHHCKLNLFWNAWEENCLERCQAKCIRWALAGLHVDMEVHRGLSSPLERDERTRRDQWRRHTGRMGAM